MTVSDRGPHDLGGRPSDYGPIDLAEPPVKYWEKQVHALYLGLAKKKLMTVNELRKHIEGLPQTAYENLTYFEKWAATITSTCLERGTITQQELDAALGPPLKDEDSTVRFKAGDYVRIKQENSAVRWRRPHLRTPGYIFGVVGQVERDCMGSFSFPDTTAYFQEAPKQPMYRVRFAQSDIWEGYEGNAHDTVDIEIYQPWLEQATAKDLEDQRSARASQPNPLHPPHDHDHDHEHGHSHEHDHGDHTHEAREKVEQNAIDLEGDDAERRRLPEAIVRVVTEKGVVTAGELREIIEQVDSLGQKMLGRVLVAKAWTDPDYKKLLMENPTAAVVALGPDALPPAMRPFEPQDPGSILSIVENTEGVHNLVVCTLCSCYPSALLGMSPPWYKSRAYRARAVREPRKVLQEFGTDLPAGTAIRVHDSTADLRYLVLPQRPAGTQGWTAEQLQELVTRDSMIGVALPKTPSTA